MLKAVFLLWAFYIIGSTIILMDKGIVDHEIMTAAAFNFTKWLRMPVYFFSKLFRRFEGLFMEKTLIFQ